MESHRTRWVSAIGLLGLVWVVACRPAKDDAPARFLDVRLGASETVATPFPLMEVGPAGPGLRQVLNTLERARKDASTVGVLLRLDNMPFSRAEAQEIAGEIQQVRKAGKLVVAYAEWLDNAAYALASQADRVLLAPVGTVDLLGLSLDILYYKDLLDKIGVREDFERMGEYKTAVEPFTRASMSPDAKRMFDRLLDDLYEQLVRGIASGRKMPASRVRSLIDGGPYTAREAVKARLLDGVAYEDELDALLDKLAKKDVALAPATESRRHGDYSGFIGFMRLWSEATSGQRGVRSRRAKIALVRLEGVIVSGKVVEPFGSGGYCASGTVVEAINDVASDKTVKAIVLRVDSPGGDVLASDVIWRAVRQARASKPVIVSMGSVAASGGYYVSMAADHILADAGTLTGSIGVFGGKLDLSGLYRKLGVRKEVLTRGRNATFYDESSGFTPSERERVRAQMQEVYRDFVSKATEGRKTTHAKIEAVAKGQVWTGREAVARGLVDELGGLKRAFEIAKRKAGYSSDVKFELLVLPEPPSLLEALFRDEEGGSRWGSVFAGNAAALRLPYLERLARTRVFALLPFLLRVR